MGFRPLGSRELGSTVKLSRCHRHTADCNPAGRIERSGTDVAVKIAGQQSVHHRLEDSREAISRFHVTLLSSVLRGRVL
jgi:hypothetical protein